MLIPASALILEELRWWLQALGYDQVAQENTGTFFVNATDDTCLIVDTIICDLPDHPYVTYTTRQNELMHTHDRVYRFLFDQADEIEAAKDEILMFLNGESDPEKIKRFGGNRTELEPGPTPPEDMFEDCFFQAFGDRMDIEVEKYRSMKQIMPNIVAAQVGIYYELCQDLLG